MKYKRITFILCLIIILGSAILYIGKKGLANIRIYQPGYSIVVDKSRHLLILYLNGDMIEEYAVNMGSVKGNKEAEGDKRTPEGNFRIASINRVVPSHNVGARWILLDTVDRARQDYIKQYGKEGERRIEEFEALHGRIKTEEDILEYNKFHTNTQIWHGVGIHGGRYYKSGKGGNDRTNGCIALANRDLEELFGYLENSASQGRGVPVIVKK